MRKFLALIGILVLTGCKSDKKVDDNEAAKADSTLTVVEEPKKPEIELPPNTVQMNEEVFDITEASLKVTGIQCLDKGNDEYLLKVFIEGESFENFTLGGYSFFIQLYPNEINLDYLTEDQRVKKHIPLSINLKDAKPYGDGYVLFKGFSSQLDIFDRMVFGIYDSAAKGDVFRRELLDPILKP